MAVENVTLCAVPVRSIPHFAPAGNLNVSIVLVMVGCGPAALYPLLTSDGSLLVRTDQVGLSDHSRQLGESHRPSSWAFAALNSSSVSIPVSLS